MFSQTVRPPRALYSQVEEVQFDTKNKQYWLISLNINGIILVAEK